MKRTAKIEAARKFASKWAGRGYEKGETQSFWLGFLQNVLGVTSPMDSIIFEYQVELGHTSFIDAYIPETKVLIEQKGRGKNLLQAAKQSDGTMLTPFGQAKRYADELPASKKPRYIVTCNFEEFYIYDMETPHAEPYHVLLSDLEKEVDNFNFLIKESRIKSETQVSVEAGALIGRIYDAIRSQYINPDAPETLHSLNVLCVRLVFCLYAEDAGILGPGRDMFHDYLEQFDSAHLRQALIDLFKVLNTKPEERDVYMEERLAAFPYAAGGLFADEGIEIPRLNDEIRTLLIKNASDEFDWSRISPTIFGAVFESTLNPETRRSGGMHYTSVENIHKVIEPLFLNNLKEELSLIKAERVDKTRTRKLREFQNKLASLKFLDPACGSGNFLTETYLSLRRLENEVVAEINRGQMVLGQIDNPIKVSIDQFYGIEINGFATTVAATALWIAESQMMAETERIVQYDLDPLPLRDYSHIHQGNALRLDWNDIVPAQDLSYIAGNPPFVGYSLQTESQKQDILDVFREALGSAYKNAGKIDYVAAWYYKAAQYIKGTHIRCALVSTNSITQGEQVSIIWNPLFEQFGVHIDFAWRTFVWDSEANLKAHVHCVIIGFSSGEHLKTNYIYDTGIVIEASNINPYLIDAENIIVESHNKPLCNVPCMTTGNRPADGGNLIIEADEYDRFIKDEPASAKYIKRLVGAQEFINNKPRYCLWLKGISPAELRDMPLVLNRVEMCRKDREAAPDSGRRKLAEVPHLFRETLNPLSFMIVPATSSESRYYVPIGFLDSNTIPTNAVIIIPDATLYHFGVLTSTAHMSWMRAVCGRLKSDYRYSKDIVYNNFPWPSVTEQQRQKIEATAQAILDARALYPECSLADLYDDSIMPPELRKAHKENDAAVMATYGFPKDMDEPAIVAELLKMYQQIVSKG